MKKFLALLLIVAGLAVSAPAQDLGNSASDFGNYQLRSNAAIASGAQTMVVRGFPLITTADGRSFNPISTTTPLRIDNGAGVAETVTPSSVTCSDNPGENGCSFVATFSNAHGAGASIQSASFGLCEAINYTGSGIVVVTKAFGGTSSTITSATLGGACDQTDVDIVDFRTGGLVTFSSVGGVYTGGGGAVNGGTVSEVDRSSNNVHTSVITLTATPLTVTDALAYAGLKIYDFPEGRVFILGSTGSLTFTTTSALASTINSGAAMDWALGTVTASSITLATTMLDILPKVDNPTSTTINVAAAATTGALVAAAQFDGTATAKDVFLNVSFPTDTEIDADGTLTVTGTITITWVQLGDF